MILIETKGSPVVVCPAQIVNVYYDSGRDKLVIDTLDPEHKLFLTPPEDVSGDQFVRIVYSQLRTKLLGDTKPTQEQVESLREL